MARKGRKPRFPSWLTTDDHEVEMRRQRAQAEPMKIRRRQPGSGVYADYAVTTKEHIPGEPTQQYIVELRSLERCGNYCTCPDFAKNQLGTCKHIEKVLLQAAQRRSRVPARSPFVEVFMQPGKGDMPMAHVPDTMRNGCRQFLAKHLNAVGNLRNPWQDTLQVLVRDLAHAPSEIQERVRVSRAVRDVAEELARRRQAELHRERFAAECDPRGLLRHPLYDYQVKGTLHLAFTGRAMLADEMGLGKTVQAIAAACVLKDLYDVRRVLIVCPVSLKTEWEEQIRKFTNLPIELVFGLRPQRLRRYRETDAFFVISNYEQILRDEVEISTVLQPDLIILDEAQRIKNWKTKTARAVKRLASRFAFVLTGTPLENRIDEVYSLVEFIDPRILGSLFRFNREFYTFDEDGRVAGMKNLRKLHEKLQPVMLRRRKDEIRDQLPDRVDNNYFVNMTAEQLNRYGEYERLVSILLNTAQRRPLRPEEMERLQTHLNCMRILCDSVYILDRKITEAPKVDELMKILGDIWSGDPKRKVIIFSEWVRMLDLVRHRFEDQGIDHSWHTGSVPQRERREQINRFKKDPGCRVFLSSDSGGLGLNLQVASVVINLDLPWNPAKLEQRIARAWRKHQKSTVNVINLVAEKTIEHRMLGTLDFKQKLADGVLDARADFEDLAAPSARSRFVERLETVLNTNLAKPEAAAPPAKEVAVEAVLPPSEQFRQEVNVGLKSKIGMCRASVDESGRVRGVMVVAKGDADTVRGEVEEALEKTHGGSRPSDVSVLTPEAYALMKQLAAAGLITINDKSVLKVFEADGFGERRSDDVEARRKVAEPLLKEAERKAKMASVLSTGGFPVEALDPMRAAAELAGRALVVLTADAVPEAAPAFAPSSCGAIRKRDAVSGESVAFLQEFAEFATEDEAEATGFLQRGCKLIEEARTQACQLALA